MILVFIVEDITRDWRKTMTGREILDEMNAVLGEIGAAGLWLEGYLLENKKNKYTKKDGTVSVLLKHLRKKFAALPPGHAAWGELSYFGKRKASMRYGWLRRNGYSIGSGVVEAACRTDVARRCKQSGMHWRIANAAAMCALVARSCSGNPAYRAAA
jgi:hypothetical protein